MQETLQLCKYSEIQTALLVAVYIDNETTFHSICDQLLSDRPVGESILIQLVVHEVRAQKPLSDSLCLRQCEQTQAVGGPTVATAGLACLDFTIQVTALCLIAVDTCEQCALAAPV